jgi:hypothetical protein
MPLARMLAGFGLELAGRAAARLAGTLGIAVHPSTVLRLVMALPDPVLTSAPKVTGLDDFAMREFTAPQADDLYELLSERAGKPGRSLILTSNRSPVDWYPLFPNPVVGESILDRVLNTSHHLLLDGKSYRPRRRGVVAFEGTRAGTASI